MCHSVGNNNIKGNAANHLTTVVLDHAAMTEFCGIPLASLRENSITELNLSWGGVGVPGAIVLSKLLPSATAITSLKYTPATQMCLLSCQRPLTRLLSHRSYPALRLHIIAGNFVGAEGAAALAAILKETQIQELRCAATQYSVRFCVSAH